MSTAPELSPAEAARVAAFDTAPVPPECDPERVETVARALVARCENRREPDGQQCTGHLHYRWGQSDAACDACGARCGIAVAAWTEVRPSPAEEALRDALRAHHPIMRSETGPFSGCRCGQVRLGQDVIAHVVGHLRAALPPSPAEEAVKPADEFLMEAARGWILRHTTQPGGDRWGYDPDHLAWAAENLLVDLAPWLNQAGRDEAEWQRAGDWHAGYAAGKAGAWGFIARLRAALASPAPAPQGEEGQR